MPESKDPSAAQGEVGLEFENVEISEADGRTPGASRADTEKESEGPGQGSGPGEGSGQPVLSPEEQALKDIAATAGKVAGAAALAVREAEEAAKSLFSEVVVDSTDTISRIAGGLSSWWSNLDPTSEAAPAPAQAPKESASRIAEKVQELYGLSESDTLLEQFPCSLSQTYNCVGNECTPTIQVVFPIVLSITELNFCFCAEHEGRKYTTVIPHARLKSVDRVQKDKKDMLEVLLNDGPKLTFNSFASDTALESALALLEHLATSDR